MRKQKAYYSGIARPVLEKTEVKTYTVWDTKSGKTFATEAEALGYESAFRKRTGRFVSVTAGTKKVTHTYRSPYRTVYPNDVKMGCARPKK